MEHPIQLPGICTGFLIFTIHRWARRNPPDGVADWPKSLGLPRKSFRETDRRKDQSFQPFGALDAQTRSEMQRFLLELWRSWHPTVLFITYDVDEAILLSDCIVVMTPRPGTIALDISVSLKRPRQWDVALSQEFLTYKKRILSVLRREVG
ncbi:MAG: hypothetical protein C7B46_09095 [Sulfobacillus benefaciens]|uniref:Uncharacterized protein n=1 Tax=Sulfobacillus benefaciens TaxID=453960 RepID=A0A2T2XGV8_9FIRM|nr:MAG: hypothetical protein C7B46_09095 [Sulfobacillus benefaciens]